MALSQRLESLKKRHALIEQQLTLEESYHSPDAALLHQLKREKLILKDEIARIDVIEQAA